MIIKQKISKVMDNLDGDSGTDELVELIYNVAHLEGHDNLDKKDIKKVFYEDNTTRPWQNPLSDEGIKSRTN